VKLSKPPTVTFKPTVIKPQRPPRVPITAGLKPPLKPTALQPRRPNPLLGLSRKTLVATNSCNSCRMQCAQRQGQLDTFTAKICTGQLGVLKECVCLIRDPATNTTVSPTVTIAARPQPSPRLTRPVSNTLSLAQG
jgi:hypothetical protein